MTGQAQDLQKPDVLPSQVDLPFVDAMAGRVGKGVVVVMPTLTEGERSHPRIVFGVVPAVMADLAPAMGGRIHQPGELVDNRQAQGDAPKHQGPATDARGVADPVEENPQNQLQGEEPTVQPAVIGIDREIASKTGHGSEGRNPDEHPAHVGPPKAQVAVVVVDSSVGKLVVVPVQTDPVNRAVLAAQGSAGGQDTLQPMGHPKGAMAEKTVIAQGDPQASGDPVKDQQGDQGLPAPEPWQQGHQGQAMDRRHVKDDSPACPGCLTGPAVQSLCAVRIQTNNGRSPGMERLEPGGSSGGTGGEHEGRNEIQARMIAVRIHIRWDTEQISHQAASPFRI